MANVVPGYPGGSPTSLQVRQSIETAVGLCAAGDVMIVQGHSAGWGVASGTDPTDGTYYTSFELANQMSAIFTDNVFAAASSFVGNQACIVGVQKKANTPVAMTISGAGSIDGALMPQTEEHRHCLLLRGSSNITIDGILGLTLKNSGGDGLYIGPTELDQDTLATPCSNITVKNLTMTGNRRQGCSVLSAINLLFQRCNFLRSQGTSTWSGLSFEPEENTTGYSVQHNHQITNVVVEDCVGYGNIGSDFYCQLLHLTNLHQPVSLTYKRCKSYHDAVGADPIYDPWGFGLAYSTVTAWTNGDGSVAGTINYLDCSVDGLKYAGLQFTWRIDSKVNVNVRNMRIRRCATVGERPIDMVLSGTAHALSGIIQLTNVIIEEGKNRAPISISSSGGAATNVRGSLRLKSKLWPRNLGRNSLLPNLKMGRFGRLQFSNSARSRRSAQREER